MAKPKLKYKYCVDGKYRQGTLILDVLPTDDSGHFIDPGKSEQLIKDTLPAGARLLYHSAHCDAWGNN